MKTLIALFLLTAFVFAENNYGDLVYSQDTTIESYFYNEKGGKIIVNNGVKIIYNTAVYNRDGAYFENNGEITNKDNDGIHFSNNSGATFINNGKIKVVQFSNRGTATFYSDASSSSYAGMSGNFRNVGGGTFYIIGATLTGDFEVDDSFYWNPPATYPTNTLIFGIGDLRDSSKCGTKMGQINGDFTNKSKNSVVNVNIANMVYGQKYKIITGNISGLDSVSFVGANLDSVNTYYEKGEVWVEQKSTEPEKPNPEKPNPDNPNPPPMSLMRHS